MDGLRDGRRRRRPGGRGSTRCAGDGRVVREGDRWFAAEATRDPKAVLRGRLEALGPVVRATTRCCSSSKPRASVLRTRIDGRPGLVRPAAARAHPSLHARPPAPRDRAGHRRRVPALPRLLAARRSRRTARGPARRGRGDRAARRLRGARGGLGRQRPARARARLQARMARPADALRRGRLGTPLGRRRWPLRAHPDRARPARGPGAWTALAADATRPDLRRTASACTTPRAPAARCSSRRSRAPRASLDSVETAWPS